MIGELTRDIVKALDAKLWTVALTSSLALPDICGALGSEDGIARGAHFREWFRMHLGPRYPMLPAEDAYQLRCSMLHQGRSSTRQYTRVLFTTDATGSLYHNNIIDGALNLDIRTFSVDIAEAAGRWYVKNFNEPHVRANRQALVKWHENGLPPYFVGAPVLS